MTTAHLTHEAHNHAHGPNCGYEAIQHGDHVDYVHDGHRVTQLTAITTTSTSWAL